MCLTYIVDDFIDVWGYTNNPLPCWQCLGEIAQPNMFLYQACFNIRDIASDFPHPCTECTQHKFCCQTFPTALCPEVWYLLYGNHDFSDQKIRDRLWGILKPYREGPQQLGEDEALEHGSY
ncbi:hypothetical protein POX_c04623 [Penicillium oxalicum]|uniref:hypothetical protein n=1 Tax=Penicillium oxalicum TaxID=69781 RepID=UPI0020B84D0B|nr:hypothetical protein POX_c04623 [Penicillium oxalicum]KAI2791745.1 hypothetical protein POX_c04623 [Penicillium oxalicum]